MPTYSLLPFFPVVTPNLLCSVGGGSGRSTSEGIFFCQSREIIGASMTALGLTPGDVVLAPASLCWEALSPMLALGLKIRCYAVDHQLTVDIPSIRKSIDNRTKAIYIVHYFGFPQPIEDIKQICVNEGLRLIEDCALCYYDALDNGGVGHIGDVSFFSLWKTLPVPDGAVALYRGKGELKRPIASPSGRWVGKRVSRLAANALAKAGILPTIGRLRPKVSEVAGYEALNNVMLPEPKGMSSFSKFIMERCDLVQIARERRSNFSSLLEGIVAIHGIEPVWTCLPNGAVPFAFPIRVADPVNVQKYLAQVGIETEISINRFFRNHPAIEGDPHDFVVVDSLADHVLLIPVHQNLTVVDIERILVALRGLYRKSNRIDAS